MITPDFPERLTIELADVCNYRCAMCPSRFDAGRSTGTMSPELFKRVVDEASEHLPVALVPFFRGESLLHPDLIELLSYAKKKGLGPIQIASNGSLLNDELGRALLDVGLDFISFSLDTIRPMEYAEIRQGGSLDRVMNNVENFLSLRDRHGYPTEIQISATKTELNRDGLRQFIDYWRNRADRVRIYPEHSADGHPGSLGDEILPPGLIRQACRKVFTDAVIYRNGKMAACNHDWFRAEPLGDASVQTVHQAWHGAAYTALREQHLNPGCLTDPTCRYCDHWAISYLDKQFIGEAYDRRAPVEALAVDVNPALEAAGVF